MPGMAMYDFADAVRFIANTAVEDEADLTKVVSDTAKFRAFASGFIREVKNVWTTEELQALVQASFSIAIEQTVRFLDDYLNGDIHISRRTIPSIIWFVPAARWNWRKTSCGSMMNLRRSCMM